MPEPETEQKNPSGTAPLSPRRETFLARYSRNFKISVAGLCVGLIVIPFCWPKGHAPIPVPKATVRGQESQAAIPNPALQRPDHPSPASSAGPTIINDQDDRTLKMAPAPDGGLTEDTAEGSLPRIGSDGRQPWQVYARPFNTADTRPRVAIVVTGLGLSRIETDAAIARLPANVTLAFDVQSRVVGAWCSRARQDGHETLLVVPMEPFDYPRSDPGPNTLLTTLPNTDNLSRLQWALRQSTGYVGITTMSGSRFTTDPEKLEPVLDVVKRRGLMILDSRVAPHSAVTDMGRERHIPVAMGTAQLDQNLTPEAIDAALSQLEQTARLTGHAVGITAPVPLMIDHLQAWLKELPRRGIALAPISAMVK
ncbi:MAG: divergent polysaccharide deacetylase family protein [Pseudomonadota bacterium]|nr:divergent polysaccharide deacetylase family protein [Pseudomonadota bacterium]